MKDSIHIDLDTKTIYQNGKEISVISLIEMHLLGDLVDIDHTIMVRRFIQLDGNWERLKAFYSDVS